MSKIYILFIIVFGISYFFFAGSLIGIEDTHNIRNFQVLESKFNILFSISFLISFVSVLPSFFLLIIKKLKIIR
jgi:hypothetical protein